MFAAETYGPTHLVGCSVLPWARHASAHPSTMYSVRLADKPRAIKTGGCGSPENDSSSGSREAVMMLCFVHGSFV